MRNYEYGNFRGFDSEATNERTVHASSSAGMVYTLYTSIYGIHMYTRLCDGDGGDGDGGGSGGPEGLILSSVIVTGQRHLCEEQTYLAQQAIHQIAPLDELSFHKTTGTYSDDKNVDAGSRRRAATKNKAMGNVVRKER